MKSRSNSLITSTPILLLTFFLAVFSVGNPLDSIIILTALFGTLVLGLMAAYLTDMSHENVKISKV